MLPAAAMLVRQAMEGPRRDDVAHARRELDGELERMRERVRALETAVVLIERESEEGLRSARTDAERAETLRASTLHARAMA
jgi:hypothetical protein